MGTDNCGPGLKERAEAEIDPLCVPSTYLLEESTISSCTIATRSPAEFENYSRGGSQLWLDAIHSKIGLNANNFGVLASLLVVCLSLAD